MTREAIKEYLVHPKHGEKYQHFLTFCKEPKNYNEIKMVNFKLDRFKALVDLKKAGALDFADGKYFTTELGLEVINSL